MKKNKTKKDLDVMKESLNILGGKMLDDPGKYIDLPRSERNYENRAVEYNDLTQLVHQLAVFHIADCTIYKLNVIDYVGQRYECSGETKSRWAHFSHAWLFNFTNEEEFEHYYNEYLKTAKRPKSRETMKNWLSASRSRLGYQNEFNTEPNQDPFIKNSKRT